MITPFPIHNDDDYRRALEVVDEFWGAAPGSPEADTLDVMATLVEVYEKASRALPPPDPRALVAFKLRELGWSQRELARRLAWGGGRVSEVLSGRRGLTLRMVQELSAVLGLPAGQLVHESRADDHEHVWVRLPQTVAARVVDAGLEASALDELVARLVARALAPLSVTRTEASVTTVGGPTAPRGGPAPHLTVHERKVAA